MSTRDSWIAVMLEQVSDRFEPWMSCDECFDRSDVILEAFFESGAPLPADFRAHLAGCAACRDELETLAELEAIDRGIDAATARERLEAQLA
jgi:hypothetical protein